MDEKLKQVTYRIPGGLSDAIDHAAEKRGITVSQFVRDALEEAVNPKRRRFEYPGYTPEFDAFIAERAPKDRVSKPVLVLVEDFRGQRVFYDGAINEKTAGSVLVLSTVPGLIAIPRHYIHAWYALDDAAFLPTLVQMLTRDGWRPARNYF